MYSVNPKTAEEYVRLVDQAIIETEELRACYEYDMDDPGTHLRYLEPLEQMLRELRAQMAEGSYQFGDEDLPFMDIVNKQKEKLPFSHLLAVINHTHRNGLAIDD